jgi:hypothetical protein
MHRVLIKLLSVIALNKTIVSATPRNHHPGSWQIGRPVNTTSGVVQGHSASLAPEVSEYLGIPYGKPTTGDLRFAAPVMYVGGGIISGANYVSYAPLNKTLQVANILSTALIVSVRIAFDIVSETHQIELTYSTKIEIVR